MQVFLGKKNYISYAVESTRGTFNSSLSALPVYDLKLLSLEDSYIKGGYIDSTAEPTADSNLYTGTSGTFEFYMPLLASDDSSLASSYHDTYYDMLKAMGFVVKSPSLYGEYTLGWPIDYCLSFRLGFSYFQVDFKGCSLQRVSLRYQSTGNMLVHMVFKGILHYKGRATAFPPTSFDNISYNSILSPGRITFNNIHLEAKSVGFDLSHKLNVAATDFDTGRPTFTYIAKRAITANCVMYNTLDALKLNTVMAYLGGNTDIDMKIQKGYGHDILSFAGRTTAVSVKTDSLVTIDSQLIVTDKNSIELCTFVIL